MPDWLRWTGVGIGFIAGSLIIWTLRNLGKNLTDTVVTRKEHTLVTSGPYRWIRHPFYLSAALAVFGNSFAAANWFLLLTGCVLVVLLMIRARKEEKNLIARFGHRAPAELELANPSWRMDPRPVLDTARLELRRGEGTDDAPAIRARAEAELAGRVPKVKLPIVRAALRKSQAMMASRENGKLPAVVLWDELRRLLAAAAPGLVERGVLPDVSAIHYLRHDELGAVLRGDAGPGAAEIERRREAHRRCLALDLPELVEVGPGWLRPLDDAFIRARGMLPPEKLAADATRLHGIAAAPGTVTGTARVLFDPFDEFEAGDVLFARTVDPGWAPVLACAGAVVLDIGGVLSHGAVVARELGIPCVVNVKVGTERAVSGSTVTVDGSAGEVRLG